jgi:DNA-binding MarR family transcriptional regulator/GNAT superfamily N-acetyltransferase
MNDIEALRSFNRFYTRVLGLFHPRILGGGQTLVEARVLFEVRREPGLSSADLGRMLDLDRGHLSRVVNRLVRQGLVRKPERHAGRRGIPLTLTDEGARVIESLEARSSAQAAELLAPLDAAGRGRLARALAEVRSLLGGAGGARAGVVIRGARPGDMGRVIERHAALYGESHGFDADFEKYVLLGMADWLRSGDGGGALWVAEAGGVFLGSVAVVRAGDGRAQLRWLLVEPEARGRGVGRLLVERAVSFARGKGYAELFLWTLDFLAPAKALYRSVGFVLAESVPGVMGGKPCVEERWAMALKTGPDA